MSCSADASRRRQHWQLACELGCGDENIRSNNHSDCRTTRSCCAARKAQRFGGCHLKVATCNLADLPTDILNLQSMRHTHHKLKTTAQIQHVNGICSQVYTVSRQAACLPLLTLELCSPCDVAVSQQPCLSLSNTMIGIKASDGGVCKLPARVAHDAPGPSRLSHCSGGFPAVFAPLERCDRADCPIGVVGFPKLLLEPAWRSYSLRAPGVDPVRHEVSSSVSP